MTRIAGLTVMFLFVVTASAFAQEPQPASNAPGTTAETTVSPSQGTASPSLFGKASIERAVARSGARVPVQTKKPFFKTPWPYVIIGAAVAVVAIVLASGSSSSNGPY
jgi:hypothetical protein